MPPTPTSTLSLRQSAHGHGRHTSPTGWLMHGLFPTGKSVSAPQRQCLEAQLDIQWRECTSATETDRMHSFIHDRHWSQLEARNRCLCARKHSYGPGHHDQRQDRCNSSHSLPSPRTYAVRLLLQLLRRPVPLCPGYRLAWCTNHYWWSMHGSAIDSNLAKFREHSGSHWRSD